MATKKDEAQRVVLPNGKLVWPKLTTPDTKFDVDGVYSVKVHLPVEQVQPLLDKMEKMAKDKANEVVAALKADGKAAQAKKVKLADKPYDMVLDDDGNETGMVEMRAKLNAKGHDKKTGRSWDNRVALFDAKRVPIKGDISVWTGSEGLVCFDMRPFYMAAIGAGVSCKLKAVILTKVVSGGEGTADDFFGDTEIPEGATFEWDGTGEEAPSGPSFGADDGTDDGEDDGEGPPAF